MRVLIVEDEGEIVSFIKLELEHEGHAVEAASDGRTGLQMALERDFDMILLDVMLPELNGLEVLRRLRTRKNTPVILLTARDALMDKVTGLDAGANDYITKPFHVEELFARMRAIARMAADVNAGEVALTLGDIALDRRRRRVTRVGEEIPLTKTQFDLLEYMMLNRDIVLTREQLLSAVWGYSYAGDSNIVDVYVRYLRIRLHEPGDSKLIETVRGVGYVLRSPA
jgi:DNA-binding response OmpR family regulator